MEHRVEGTEKRSVGKISQPIYSYQIASNEGTAGTSRYPQSP